MKRALVLAWIVVACAAPPPTREGTASIDPAYASPPDGDERAEARAALERDAWRREGRFLDAVEPGRALAQTRVPVVEIHSGLWSAEELATIGRALFDHSFTRAEGLGSSELPGIARVLGDGRPDARRCTACHARRGSVADTAFLDGDGDSVHSAIARTPPSLDGAAWIELLAAERTTELARLRDAVVATARSRGVRASVQLVIDGADFGALAAGPNGTLDTSGLEGVGPDLVVRPFGWTSTHRTLRDAIDVELATHLGLDEEELDEGQRIALTVALGRTAVPLEEVPPAPDLAIAHARGRRLFDSLGCASCHVPTATVASAVWRPAPGLAIDLARDGATPRADGVLWLYSDLALHDVGPALADARDGSSTFRTPPLWGVADTAPYLHDGRAPTFDDAILAHGGEAQAARDAYAALEEAERGPLRVFLAGLTHARRLEVP